MNYMHFWHSSTILITYQVFIEVATVGSHQWMWWMVKEASFRPRRQLIVKQRWFQSIHKHTYMKSLIENVTASAIPLALVVHACSHCKFYLILT
ncbi:putative cytochrome c oxidase subunit VII [Helianthus anomalus]